jgi:hypothetical protein
MGMITPAPIVRWQKWASERTAYIRVFYPDDAVAVFAKTYPHVVKAIEESSLTPECAVSVLYSADDNLPMRLYSILDDALADAEKIGFVVASIDWGHT